MPPNISLFSRNRCTCVEQIDGETLRARCRLQDTLTDGEVELLVSLPDLEIKGVKASFRRSPYQECLHPPAALDRVVGVRIGAGMLKIVKGLLGEVTACRQLAFMVEECCHGVILSMTKETLQQAPEDLELTSGFYTEMVRQNIRLYNRCAAFAPGSPLVEGIEPPE